MSSLDLAKGRADTHNVPTLTTDFGFWQTCYSLMSSGMSLKLSSTLVFPIEVQALLLILL